MYDALSRRQFIKAAALGAVATSIPSVLRAADPTTRPALFKLDIAEWCFHRAIRAGQMSNLDFPKKGKDLGFDVVEYVSQLWPSKDKAKDEAYLKELKQRQTDNGMTALILMVDDEGSIGDPDAAKRKTAVENHYKWADAAKFLGCQRIRVNAASRGAWEDQIKLCAESLTTLVEYCAKQDMDCIVENHGGLSSNGQWLVQLMKTVNHPRCGTLPDFDNFRISNTETYDRYKGIAELMPYAKGVSGKFKEFDAQGNEANIDMRRMMKIVVDSGYHGYVEVEYEGNGMSEEDGTRAGKKLLEKIIQEMSA